LKNNSSLRYIFNLEMMHALIDEYGKTQHSIQELWLENDACLMENAFMLVSSVFFLND
jgi:hypothetical protein